MKHFDAARLYAVISVIHFLHFTTICEILHLIPKIQAKVAEGEQLDTQASHTRTTTLTMAASTTTMERKWHVELNDARESDLPSKLEPIGFCRGVVAERVRSHPLSISLAALCRHPTATRHVAVVVTLWKRIASSHPHKCMCLLLHAQESNSAVAKTASNTRDLKQKVCDAPLASTRCERTDE